MASPTRWPRSLVALVLATAACGDRPEAEPVPEAPPVVVIPTASPSEVEALASARQAADRLGAELMGLLLTTLESKGPLAAVAYCADSAQARTAALGTAGVQVRRVTTKPRNLANAPDELEEELLRALAEAHVAGRLPADTALWIGEGPERELRYLRPILVQPRCLTCHGDPGTFPPSLRDLLAQRYPQDQAVGYVDGDLRGAISVRVSVAEP